jgi:hypothetical protein
MTPCTICAAPCPGTDDDDEACCLACHLANFAGADLQPLAARDAGGRVRLVAADRRLPAYARALMAQEGGA